jgi:hypothetical protein
MRNIDPRCARERHRRDELFHSHEHQPFDRIEGAASRESWKSRARDRRAHVDAACDSVPAGRADAVTFPQTKATVANAAIELIGLPIFLASSTFEPSVIKR